MIDFGQPLALWTGLAVGLPILAHLAYQTVTKKHAFSSLRFIRPSTIPRTGKKTPSDLLLLLLRILLFILLAILLSDPYWVDKNAGSTPESGKQTVIAVDLSPSMKGWNGLSEAKSQAKQVIEKGEGIDFGFVGFAGSEIVTMPIGSDKQALSNAIEGIDHLWIRGNAQGFLDRIPEMFNESAKEKKIVIISDFQSGDWQSAYRDLPSEGISFELIRVGERQQEGGRSVNRTVMEARAVPVGSEKIRVWVVVRNWEAEKVNAQLSLFAGGQIKETQTIELTPLGSTQAQFILQAGDFSNATACLVSGDDYDLDDNRSLWLKAPPPRRFGFWHGDQIDGDTEEELDYLKTAVISSGDQGWNRWEWNQDLADGLRLGNDDIGFELLFVMGLQEWFEKQELAVNLQMFLDRGGVALITPAEPFSESFSIVRQSGLMKFEFSRVVGGATNSRDFFRIAALSENSNLAEIFAGNSARDLYLTAFSRFGMLKNLEQNLEVPLQDRDGRPLAVVRNFESGGRLVFLPFRINPRWTDLPLRNSFLPLLMELVKKGRSVASARAWPVLEPGESWTGGELFVARKPGTFRFEDQWIEVVPSLVESSPETLKKSEVEMLLGGKKKLKSAGLVADDLKQSNQKSLWLWFAIAAAIILIVEMIWSKPKLSQLEENA